MAEKEFVSGCICRKYQLPDRKRTITEIFEPDESSWMQFLFGIISLKHFTITFHIIVSQTFVAGRSETNEYT